MDYVSQSHRGKFLNVNDIAYLILISSQFEILGRKEKARVKSLNLGWLMMSYAMIQVIFTLAV